MAAGGYGVSFQPGQAQNGTGDGPRGRVQEPIQMLSTRLPKIFGAGAIAPGALLQGAGGMGQPGARGNVVAQAIAQLVGLPQSMSPAPYESSPSAPQPVPTYSDWIRNERNLSGGSRPPLPSFIRLEPAQAPAPIIPSPYPNTSPTPQPPPTIPLPHVAVGSQPPGPGTGPTNPPLPPPFVGPVFPTPTAPSHQPRSDVEAIQGIADMLFRKFPSGF
jgi:hypothetical protein